MTRTIVYLSPYYWPEQIGSASYCTQLAEYLAQGGDTVRTLAFRPHYPSPEPFAAWADGSRDRERHEGVDIRRLPAAARGSGGFKERFRNDLGFLRAAIRFGLSSEARAADVVVAYVPSTASLIGGALIKKRTGARLVAIVHDIESGLARSLGIANPAVVRVMQRVERFALNRADEIVVLTEGMIEEVRALGVRSHVVALPIWAAVAPATLPSPGPLTLSYSGNFGRKQNLDQLLPLIARMNDRHPDVRFVLRGEGSERPRIEREVAALRVTNTRFASLAPSAEFVATLQEAHLHLVPQALSVANYAVPSKIVNILAAGRPFLCIAEPETELHRIAEASGAGISVEPGDDERIFEAVSGIVADRARLKAMGDAGQRYVASHMDRQTILDAYRNIIER